MELELYNQIENWNIEQLNDLNRKVVNLIEVQRTKKAESLKYDLGKLSLDIPIIKVHNRHSPGGYYWDTDGTQYKNKFYVSKDDIIKSVAKKRGMTYEYVQNNFSDIIDKTYNSKLKELILRKVFDDLNRSYALTTFWKNECDDNLSQMEDDLTENGYRFEGGPPKPYYDSNKHSWILPSRKFYDWPLKRNQNSQHFSYCMEYLKGLGEINIELHNSKMGIVKKIKAVYT
jgi:hypothetical protein